MKYEIQGENLPVVICTLEDGEQMITQHGGMSWMSPNVDMATSTRGGLGKALGRMFSGEGMFQNIYTATGGPGLIAFAAAMPGCIRPYEISPGNEIIVQKKGFLASEASVQLDIFFHKKLGSGLFGGEGFILQKLSGNGTAFVEFDGHVVEYDLQAGQQIIMDTAHLAAMSATCKMEIKKVPGVKNVVFGGEGLFNTCVTGPGKVWIQTMPIGKLAACIIPYMPASS